MQLCSGLVYALAIAAVDDEEDSLDSRVIVAVPNRPYLLAASKVSNEKVKVLVPDGFDVAADCEARSDFVGEVGGARTAYWSV